MKRTGREGVEEKLTGGWKIKNDLPFAFTPFHLPEAVREKITAIKDGGRVAWPPELIDRIEEACGIYKAHKSIRYDAPTEKKVACQLQKISETAAALRDSLIAAPLAVRRIAQKSNELLRRSETPSGEYFAVGVHDLSNMPVKTSKADYDFFAKAATCRGLDGLREVSHLGDGGKLAGELQTLALVADFLRGTVPSRGKGRPLGTKDYAEMHFLGELVAIFRDFHGGPPLRPSKSAEIRGPLDALIKIIEDADCLDCGNCSKLILEIDYNLRESL